MQSKIEKLIDEDNRIKALRPIADKKELSNFGDVRFRIDCSDLVITKKGGSSMDNDQSFYLKIPAAKDLYEYLKEYFQDEK